MSNTLGVGGAPEVGNLQAGGVCAQQQPRSEHHSSDESQRHAKLTEALVEGLVEEEVANRGDPVVNDAEQGLNVLPAQARQNGVRWMREQDRRVFTTAGTG